VVTAWSLLAYTAWWVEKPRRRTTSVLCLEDRCIFFYFVFNNVLMKGVFRTFDMRPVSFLWSMLVMKNELILQGATVGGPH
jgi:hypothetical protein